MQLLRRLLAPPALLLLAALAGCSQNGANTRAEEPRASLVPGPSLIPGIFLEPAERGAPIALRRVYDPGLELTATMEGYRGQVYSDPAGFCTIGFGHLIKRARCDGSEPARFLRGLDRAAAMALLRADMGLAEAAVSRLVEVELSDGQYAALCDFVFNVGRGRLAKSTLLKHLNSGSYEKVPVQLRRYVIAGGKRLRGLEIRREEEIALYWDGLIIPRSVPDPDEDLSPIDIALP